MSLRETILSAQKEAMKNRDESRVAILRMLWSAIRNAEIDNGHKELSDEEIQKVISTQIKQQKDAIVDFTRGNRQDLVDKANSEIAVLQSYMPEQMGDAELEELVKKIISENVGGVSGKVIGVAMKEIKGRADGNRVRLLVEKLLSNN